MAKKKQKKRLRAKITVGYDDEGKAIYKYASGYSKKELDSSVKELKKKHINGATEIQRDMLFGRYARDWYYAYKSGKVRPSTDYKYQLALNNRLLPAFGDRQMRAISAIDLQQYIGGLAGECRTLINDTTSILRNIFRLAYAQGIIDRDPSAALVKPKAAKKQERRALTVAESNAAKKVIDQHADGLLLAILYYTGLRRGEALALRWTDIDVGKKQLHVQREIDPRTDQVGPVKTESSDRYVPIPDALLDKLIMCAPNADGYVVSTRTGSYWHTTTFNKHWPLIAAAIYEADPTVEAKALKLVKYTREKKRIDTPLTGSALTPHYFRHNYASVLYAADVDVLTAQRYLGHADPLTTMRIYTHLSDAKSKTDAGLVQAAFSGNFLATSSTYEREQAPQETSEISEHTDRS